MTQKTIVVWFRQDLRLKDHPALAKAVAEGDAVVPLYILDDDVPGQWRSGGASRWWLHHSLAALSSDLEKIGSRLVLQRGSVHEVLPAIAKSVGASAVFTSRMYEPWAVAAEQDLHEILKEKGVELRRFAGSLLKEPEAIQTQTGGPYKVYTPFWRALSSGMSPRKPLAKPKAVPAPSKWPKSDKLTSWKLLPTKPNWAKGFEDAWLPGELGAHKRLKSFLTEAVQGYHEQRNRPDIEATSRLSPHLHFGEISPAAIWYATANAGDAGVNDKDYETFLKELVWREFSAHLLFHFPSLPDTPFRPEFAQFPWKEDKSALEAWQRGQTGYPIVDAGMRELWATGWMHNRVRMIAASFLIKDLLIPWQAGEAWFWDTLVDADLASNSASWQWVAGSGADAAPYFRIFNPITQGEKFDPNADYVRKWVPEIAGLPDKHIHAPWTAPEDALAKAKVTLGETYPHPIVDHAEARKAALAGYARVKAA